MRGLTPTAIGTLPDHCLRDHRRARFDHLFVTRNGVMAATAPLCALATGVLSSKTACTRSGIVGRRKSYSRVTKYFRSGQQVTSGPRHIVRVDPQYGALLFPARKRAEAGFPPLDAS